MIDRMQLSIRCLANQCKTENLPTELILVEWNPPNDRPSLMDAMVWNGITSDKFQVRIIHVPSAIHEHLNGPAAIPLHQFIAKNVGIRRAKGRFVLATNVDILLSNELVHFLGQRTLRPGHVYRVDRHDATIDPAEFETPKKTLKATADSVIRIHKKQGTLYPHMGVFDRIYRDPRLLWLFSHFHPLAVPFYLLRSLFSRLSLPTETSGTQVLKGWDAYRQAVKSVKRSLKLFNLYGKFLHTNACGDFTLMDRKTWFDLHGYWEFTGFPLHIDGLICHAAKACDVEEVYLPPPCLAFHMEHGNATGYEQYRKKDFAQDMGEKGIPMITEEDFFEILLSFARSKDAILLNDENWGFQSKTFTESSP